MQGVLEGNSFNLLTFILLLGGLVVLARQVFFIHRRKLVLRDGPARQERDEIAREVLEQRNLLERRTRNIEDSLRYAQRIQKAVFNSPDELAEFFPDSFVYQRAKEVVSGDFFWVRPVSGKILFAVADCTGHGVPGAFMSLIGHELFRQIVVERQELRPSRILDELNLQFDEVFGNMEDLALKDGIDLAFCAYNPKTSTLEYAGAFKPLYLVRDNEVREFKGDRVIVGPDYGLRQRPFTNYSLQLQKDDVIYLFSDGYADQFGGPEGKKFKYRRFRRLLLSIHRLPMEEQRQKLEENMRDWMGAEEQIDDQLVIGIRPAGVSSS
jgi:serine phosphatase RsbU (regulator of sigma subunit)